MAQSQSDQDVWRMTRQVILGLLIILSVALFALWRIDNPRVERLRMAVADAVFPAFDWTSRPAATLTRMAEDFESYVRVYEENQELRREVQDLRGWREAAIQLEQRNARLRALNNVRLSPQMRFVTGEVLTDTGGPFSQSGLVNVGRRNGVQDGAAAMDGLGLVGRVSGVGEETSRIIYLTDINSRVPVVLQRTGQRAVVTGDNTGMPLVQFVEAPERVRPGDRVMTSGDGRVLPPDLLVGVVVRDSENRLRVRPAAEYARLEFVRILNFRPPQSVEGPGGLIGAALPASPTEEGVVNE